jgi:hypothetical protein
MAAEYYLECSLLGLGKIKIEGQVKRIFFVLAESLNEFLF